MFTDLLGISITSQTAVEDIEKAYLTIMFAGCGGMFRGALERQLCFSGLEYENCLTRRRPA